MSSAAASRVLGLLASASPELAAQAVTEPEQWRVTFTPYVWMSGLEGTIGAEGGENGASGSRPTWSTT